MIFQFRKKYFLLLNTFCALFKTFEVAITFAKKKKKKS